MKLQGMRRDARSVLVATLSTILAGPNPHRFALLIGCPIPSVGQFLADGTLTPAVDTSTTGIKSTYTVPAGQQAFLTSATQFETTGTTVVSRLQIVRGATTFNVATVTNNGTFSGRIPLQAGDVVQWNVITNVVASVTDYTINIERDAVESRVTIALAPPAVLDAGINLYAGGPPVLLCYDQLGSALHEDVAAIATPAAVTIGVVDVFWP